MKAITINNPFAWFAVFGVKDVENRSRPTNYRGPLLIHANKEVFNWPDYFWCPEAFQKEIERHCELSTPLEKLPAQIAGFMSMIKHAENHLGIDRMDYFDAESATMDMQGFEKSLILNSKERGNPFITNSIIGKVDLVDCVKGHPSSWSADSGYQYVLENAEVFAEPIRDVKGWLGIWNFDGEI